MNDYAPFYETYVGLVPEGDVVEILRGQIDETVALLERVPPERERYRYAEGKWSVREVVGHVIDSERVFAFRAAHIGRGDPTPIPGMDQEVWAAGSNAHERPLSRLVSEFRAVRSATVHLLAGLPEKAWSHRGVASGMEVTVRGLALIIAGHELHHRGLLEERYGAVTG